MSWFIEGLSLSKFLWIITVAYNDFPDEIFISFERIGSHVKFFQWTSTISFLAINFFRVSHYHR